MISLSIYIYIERERERERQRGISTFAGPDSKRQRPLMMFTSLGILSRTYCIHINSPIVFISVVISVFIAKRQKPIMMFMNLDILTYRVHIVFDPLR